MASGKEPVKDETYTAINAYLQELVNGSDYANIRDRLSAKSISDIECQIFEINNSAEPWKLVKTAAEILRSEFKLDYDDLVFEGGWMDHLPKMVARNYLLRHFLELGNGLEGSNKRLFDATLNTAADDYTGFVDLIVIKIQTLGEVRHYEFLEEDLPKVELYLTAILLLMEYCKDMLDMSSTLRPSLFQMRNRRMEGRIRGVIEMSLFRRECPAITDLLAKVSQAVTDITNDESLRELQMARNERYKQSKMRLYRYTIRCTEDLNIQLEACDPYDFTHRADLKKQLEQVQIFQRSFDKDR